MSETLNALIEAPTSRYVVRQCNPPHSSRRILEKLAPWGPEGALLRDRLRRHYLVAAGLLPPVAASGVELKATKEGLVLRIPAIEGLDLERYVAHRKISGLPEQVSISEVCRIGIQLAEQLNALAVQGIAHGALLASHVLIDPATDKVRLLNFGYSRFVRAQLVEASMQPITCLEDLRALGKLLFWLASGRSLEQESGEDGFPVAINWEVAVINDLPAVFVAVVTRLLEAGQARGYRQASTVVPDLKRILDPLLEQPPVPLPYPGDLYLPIRRFGRDAEIAALVSAYTDSIRETVHPSSEGENFTPGSMVLGRAVMALVDGHSGMGKTAVVQAACVTMARHGARVVFGKFNQFGDSRPMWALAQALDKAIAGILDDTPERRQEMTERISETLSNHAGALFDLLPRLHKLLGPQPELPVLSGEASRTRFEFLINRFVSALGTPQSPLVLVMDDIHWADRASLDIIQGFTRDAAIRQLLVIGAYRTEAVDNNHPLHAMIEAIKKNRGYLKQLTVHPWLQDDITRLLEKLGASRTPENTEFGRLLQETTGGNPLGVLQALRAVHAAQALRYDADGESWQSIPAIAIKALRGVPIAAMVGKRIDQLPVATQDALTTAALLGASFELDSIAAVIGTSPDDALQRLWPALADGLLVMAEESVASTSRIALRPIHDIVQQSAHLRLDEHARSERRIAIGRALLAYYRASERLNEHFFEVIQQFNTASIDAISDDERRLLEELNISAGMQARRSGAANTALSHYKQALRLVENDDDADARERIFETTRNAAEAAYLAANFVELDQLLDVLEGFTLEIVDAARVQELRIQGLLARNRLAEALSIGEATLLSLETPLSPLASPDMWPEIPSFVELDLARASSERVDTALRVLLWLTPCAYITSFEMYVRVILTMVKLARRYPASVLTPISYINFGLTLCGVGRNAEGFQACELALTLSKRHHDESLRCKTWALGYGYLQHWRRPAARSLEPLLKTVTDCLVCGDQEYLGYAAFLYCDKAWGLQRLAELEATHTRHTGWVERFGHDFSWRHCLVWLQFIDALRGNNENHLRLCGTAFDERTDIEHLEAANNSFSLFTAHTLKAVLAWHRGDRDEALGECQIASDYAMTGSATLLAADHKMYWALCELGQLKGCSRQELAKKLARIDVTIGQLRAWAEISPDNFAHKLALVEAEKARVTDDFPSAWERYENAIDLAASSSFVHDKGLIAELAGDYYSRIGCAQIARERLLDAYKHYLSWGAVAVAESMLERHPWLNYEEINEVGSAFPDIAANLLDKVNFAMRDLNIERIGIQFDGLDMCMAAEQLVDGSVEICRSSGDRNDVRLPWRLMRNARKGGEYIEITVDELPLNAASDPYFIRRRPIAAVAMPIFRNGAKAGAVYIEAGGPRLFSRQFIGDRLTWHTRAIVDELRVERLTQKLERAALIDSQTGLPNRLALLKSIELALAETRGEKHRMSVVAVLRIRRFDMMVAHGVDHSSAVMSELSARLRASNEAICEIARIDRLSFGVLIDCRNVSRIQEISRSILQELDAPYLGQRNIHIETDVGITIDDGLGDAATMLREAEAALGALPQRGEQDVLMFDPNLHRQMSDRDVLVRDLRWALKHKGLRLVYQPIINMTDNSLVGAEALIRWSHPVRGEIEAEELVRVAEGSGLIRDLGHWIINAVIPQIKAWSIISGLPLFNVSFNASPLELKYADYASLLIDMAERHALPASCLAVEITETFSIVDEEATRENLQAITDFGVMLCVDDFGVGTSSLGRLHSIPARRLKIDRSLIDGVIRDYGQRTTIQMIAKLAAALNIDVVAEGVSRREEAEFLVETGLLKGQGYYYSQPLELDMMDEAIRRGSIVPEAG